MGRRAPALGGRARIQHPEVLEALDLRDVGVAVDDGIAVLEPGRESRLPPLPRPGVMDHADSESPHIDDALLRERLLQRLLVHVPGHTLERRPELRELLVELQRHEVAGMQHEVGLGHLADTLSGQRPRSAREMGV